MNRRTVPLSCAVALVCIVSPARAQDSTLMRRDTTGTLHVYKDPNRASSLSWLWPGAGHFYVGSDGKGLLFSMGSLVTGVAIIAGFTGVTGDTAIYDHGRAGTLLVEGIVANVLLSALAAADARHIARVQNERWNLGSASFSPTFARTERGSSFGFRVAVPGTR